jgi:ribosome-associated protein
VARPDKTLPEGTTFRGEKLNAKDKALLAAAEADDLKARDIVVLDVREFPSLAEYFVICTGDTKRHLRGIAGRLKDAADEHDFAVHHTEGLDMARWILVDLNNVVVHIFDPEARNHYELERLWGDAARVPFAPPQPPGKK